MVVAKYSFILVGGWKRGFWYCVWVIIVGNQTVLVRWPTTCSSSRGTLSYWEGGVKDGVSVSFLKKSTGKSRD